MINCDILIRENRRTLSITISKMGEVIVKAPAILTDSEINKYIKMKQAWINKHLEKIRYNNEKYYDIINGNSVLFFGELYEVKEVKKLKTSTLQDNYLFISETINFDKKLKEIKNWYVKSAQEILKNRLNYFSSIMNLQFNQFKITNAKTKWGSCSSNKTIDLNWRLIMMESDLQDYVIVHELCHLLEMNHSSKFYKCIEAIMPDYKIRRNKKKNYSFLLQFFR